MAKTPNDACCETSQSPELTNLEERLQKAIDKALYAGGNPNAQKLRNFLNGTWIGEPLHVILTDLPIGAWTVALVCDGLDLASKRQEFAVAADTSIAIGLLGAVGAAITGVTDWSDVDPPARRIGMIHGIVNVSAATLFAMSSILRMKKSRTTGRILAVLGYGVMTVAAHLGGKMVYECRVGVDRTAGQVFPKEFVPIMKEAALIESRPTRVEHDGVPILLVRKGTRIFAVAETCTHFSAPLSEGKLVGDSIVCPYHASRFALEDGQVINGPAVHPLPCLEVRINNEAIEIRKPSCATTKLI
jgi:nitrite reductase/ring-hydroxylating ferredoxin subunit/uncharacterized membrane protein